MPLNFSSVHGKHASNRWPFGQKYGSSANTELQEKVRANAMRLAELASLADDLVVPKRQKASNGSNQGVKKSRAVKKQSVPPSHRRTRAAGFDEQSQRYAAGLSSTQGGMCGH